MMLGAKDVAFPRLNLLSFHFYRARRALLRLRSHQRRAALRVRHQHAGRMGARYRLDLLHALQHRRRSRAPSRSPRSARFILGFSSILTGVNFIATIHMLRPKGMTWFRMPLFIWALYATAHHPDPGDARAGDHRCCS